MGKKSVQPLLCLAASMLLLVGCQLAEKASKEGADLAPRSVFVANIAFTEGPTEYRDGTIFFSEMRSSRIMRYYPEDGHYETFDPNANEANGLIFDSQWQLIACEGTPPQVTRTNIETGAVEILADSFEGKKLNNPNDVTFDSKGRLYFSDRPTPNPTSDQTGIHGVYRIDIDGSLHRILAEPEIQKPNGLVISPDDSIFYLIESHPDLGKARMILAYDLMEDGTLRNRRIFHNFYPGRSGDGMTIDAAGNLWVAAGLNRTRNTSETLDTKAGVYVFSPEGEQLDFYPINEDTVTNVAFAGPDLKTLYLTSGDKLYRIHTDQIGTRR